MATTIYRLCVDGDMENCFGLPVLPLLAVYRCLINARNISLSLVAGG